jgi:hypothetical protein
MRDGAKDRCFVEAGLRYEERCQPVGDSQKVFQTLKTIGCGDAVGTDTVVVKTGVDDTYMFGIIAGYRSEEVVLMIDTLPEPEVVLQ